MRHVVAVASTIVLVLAHTAEPVAAQHDRHAEHVSEYAGQEGSGIAALTAAELADLQSAAGMGLARAAELNHYPGPKHVLEMLPELDLTDAQAREVRAIRERMSSEATRLGEAIIEAERALDMRFRHGHIDEPSLEAAVSEVAELSGRLRFVHLLAHLETTAVLTPEQVQKYDSLRGYAAADGA